MLTLDTLNTMLAVSEEGMVEEMILALLASPQLVIFFEKFPRLKNAVTADLPRWREALRSRLKDARVPPELMEEVMCYQQSQLLSTPQFHRATAANTGVASPPAFTVCRAGEAVDGEQQYLYPCATHAFFATLAVKSGRAGHHVKPTTTGRRARAVAE